LHAGYNKSRLFLVSVIALATTGIAFSIRGNIAAALGQQFFASADPKHAAELVSQILGVEFLGFAITIAIGSPMLDFLGMGRLLGVSSACMVLGTVGAIFTEKIAGSVSPYWVLWGSILVFGIGHGLVETVVNPLAATLYPDEKTHKLNVLHAWWPGGIIIGGLIGAAFSYVNIDWRWKMATVLIPAIAFGVMMFGTKFPPTERVAAGVSARGMMREVFRPYFLVWFCAMFLTAASELAPGQWVDFALSRTVHMPGILLLVYVSGLMFGMRHFAGTVVGKLSSVGLLWVSCLLASLGLLSLSVADSKVTGLLAATVWGTGVCFMWPTMLAAASERFPKGGALLMGLMGTAGTLSIFFVLPLMGKIYDHYKAGSGEVVASQLSFRVVAILPAVLLLVFGAIWMREKSQGGFKATKITAAEELGKPITSEL
jgi:MFS family permease